MQRLLAEAGGGRGIARSDGLGGAQGRAGEHPNRIIVQGAGQFLQRGQGALQGLERRGRFSNAETRVDEKFRD
jgi:hypothetical protein